MTLTNNTFTLPQRKKTVVTTEHYEWSEKEKDWVPVSKVVSTEESDPEPNQFNPSPWIQPQPYRPYWIGDPVPGQQPFVTFTTPASAGS